MRGWVTPVLLQPLFPSRVPLCSACAFSSAGSFCWSCNFLCMTRLQHRQQLLSLLSSFLATTFNSPGWRGRGRAALGRHACERGACRLVCGSGWMSRGSMHPVMDRRSGLAFTAPLQNTLLPSASRDCSHYVISLPNNSQSGTERVARDLHGRRALE